MFSDNQRSLRQQISLSGTIATIQVKYLQLQQTSDKEQRGLGVQPLNYKTIFYFINYKITFRFEGNTRWFCDSCSGVSSDDKKISLSGSIAGESVSKGVLFLVTNCNDPVRRNHSSSLEPTLGRSQHKYPIVGRGSHAFDLTNPPPLSPSQLLSHFPTRWTKIN